MPISLPIDSETAKNQEKIKKLAKKYDLDRLDVSIGVPYDLIHIYAIKGDKHRSATINENHINWHSVQNVIETLFQ